jgi:hypothetical protein
MQKEAGGMILGSGKTGYVSMGHKVSKQLPMLEVVLDPPVVNFSGHRAIHYKMVLVLLE